MSVAVRLLSPLALFQRIDSTLWGGPDCAAAPGPSLRVRLPSPPRSPPPGACEPRVLVERLHRSAPPTLGRRPHPSLPSFLSLLCFFSVFFLLYSTTFSRL